MIDIKVHSLAPVSSPIAYGYQGFRNLCQPRWRITVHEEIYWKNRASARARHGDGVDLHVVTAVRDPDHPASWLSGELALLAAADPRTGGCGLFRMGTDMRGYNLSGRPSEQNAYQLGHLVADVAALVRATGHPRAHIVGHDWAVSSPGHLRTSTPSWWTGSSSSTLHTSKFISRKYGTHVNVQELVYALLSFATPARACALSEQLQGNPRHVQAASGPERSLQRHGNRGYIEALSQPARSLRHSITTAQI